jgi:sugar/nucleoside kinase (ribokinase family)
MSVAKAWDIVAVGDLFIDLVMTGFESLPALGEEGFAAACGRETGGGSANTSCALAKLRSRAALFGIVGADEIEWFRRRFAERGVDAGMVTAHPAMASAITVAVSTPVDRIFYTYYGPNAMLHELLGRPESLERLATARHVHFAMPVAPTLLADLGRSLRECGTTTSIDVGWQEKWLDDPCSREALAQVDWFLPNDREAERMTGESNPERMLEWFREHCARRVAIKLGPDGSAALAEGLFCLVPSIHVTPVDTTGAGDCFDAGFLYGVLSGMPIEQCLRFGNICGALSTEAAGGIAGSPSIERVREFLAT